MTEQNNNLPIKLEPLLANIQVFIPEAEAKTAKAVEAMATIETINDQDDLEYAESLLGKVKPVYDKFSALRKEITGPVDELKEFLMVYEKRVSYDGKTDNHYTRIRNMIVAYKQAELEKKQKVEREAEARRIKEDYKVELEAQIKKNLAKMVIDRVVEVDDGAKKHFDKADLASFDAAAKTFMSYEPQLKEERYAQCFQVVIDEKKITIAEFLECVEKQWKVTEPFEKWRDLVIEGITPVINDWRGKIPTLKEDKIKLANAKSEEERLKIEEQQKREANKEEARKKLEFERLQKEANTAIENEAEVNRMGNAFQEQGTVQDLGVKGPVKKVVKFTDEAKNVVKPLANVIYNCFLSPKFPGIYKLNAKKEVVLDDQGDKQYNEHIDWFLDFFVKNCDANIPGIEIIEKAKVIIRK
jgi:hypothetical protein